MSDSMLRLVDILGRTFSVLKSPSRQPLDERVLVTVSF